MENQGSDGDFELTAEMLIHGDLDDESTLSEEEEIYEGDSDELDQLQDEGELPLEDLLARYGYGGGPSGARGHSSDSESGADDPGSNAEGEGGEGVEAKADDPGGSVKGGVSDTNQPGSSKDTQSKTSEDEAISIRLETTDTTNSLSSTKNTNSSTNPIDEDQHLSKGTKSNVHTNSDHSLEVEKEGRLSLGKRQGDPVINDVMLDSKKPALMTDTDQATSWIQSGRLRRDLPERRAARGSMGSSAVDAYFSVLLDESDLSDDEFMPIIREDWKQDIKVGVHYQATIPVCRQSTALPTSYQTTPTGELKWRPRETSDKTVMEFLSGLSQSVTNINCDSERDNEEALEVLERCDHDVPSALGTILTQGLPKKELKPWSETECQCFEEGLRAHGKDFNLIQKQIPTRTVKELIEFYYIWKKSERNDLFVQQYGKIGRKKIYVPAGHISDFMNKYLDVYSMDTPDIHYSATTISTVSKRDYTS